MQNKKGLQKCLVIAGWLQVVFIVGCQDSGDSAVIDDSANYVYLNGERLINEYGGAYQKIQGLSTIDGNPFALVLGIDGSVKGRVSVSPDGSIENPDFLLNQSNELVNPETQQPFSTIGSSRSLNLLRDEDGRALIGENGGFSVTQINHLGVPENNEVFFNTRTGKLWKDSNGNLVTKKRIDDTPYLESFPSHDEIAGLNLGFRQTVASDPGVIFASAQGLYYPTWRTSGVHNIPLERHTTITAATKDGGLIVFGGEKEHYLGVDNVFLYDAPTDTVIPTTATKGVLLINRNCNFNDEILEERFHTPPTKSEIISNPDLGCWPKNIRQFASIIHSGPVGLLTKTNELWGIGSPSYGLGGKRSDPMDWKSKVALPVKIAENIKMTTLHQGGGYAHSFGYALTNDGEVFRILGSHHATDAQGNPVSATSEEAVNERFIKLKVPANDYIINLFTPTYGTRVLALGASGNYYVLGGQDHASTHLGNDPFLLELTPRPKDFFSMSIESSTRGTHIIQYLGVDGKLYQYTDRRYNFIASDYPIGVSPMFSSYVDSIDYYARPLPLKSTADIIFSEVIGGGFNFLLKDTQGNYYTKATHAFAGIFLGNEEDFGNYRVLVKLGPDIPAIEFLQNNPKFEFLHNDFRVLVNKEEKRIALIDTGAPLRTAVDYGGGSEFFTTPPRLGERARYGSVHELPEYITNKLFFSE
ncbi:TPA: hypothetical protein ACGUPM_002224 [Vibrio vulnificus]